jgi:hypothetical protein
MIVSYNRHLRSSLTIVTYDRHNMFIVHATDDNIKKLFLRRSHSGEICWLFFRRHDTQHNDTQHNDIQHHSAE